MADYTKDDIKVNYVNQVFEDGDTLTAEHMTKINAGILEAANAEKVATALTDLNEEASNIKTSIGEVPNDSTVMEEIGEIKSSKANISQELEHAGKFWKVGENGELTFEAGVPVDSTLKKSGEAADAEAVGVAIEKKGDSIAIQGQKINLLSTNEQGETTTISSVDLPASVSGLILDQDERLYISDVNNNQLGDSIDLSRYTSAEDVENMLDSVRANIRSYQADYNEDGKRTFRLKAKNLQNVEEVVSEFVIDIVDDGKQKMIINEAEYSRSPMATFLDIDENGNNILRDTVELGFSFTGLSFSGENVYLPEVQMDWYYGNDIISSRKVSSGTEIYTQDVSRFITEPRDYTFTVKLTHTKTEGGETIISTAEHSWLIEVAQINITSTYNNTTLNPSNASAQITITSRGKLPAASRDEEGNLGATMYYKIDGNIVRKTRIRSLGNSNYIVPGIEHGTKLFETYIVMYFGEDSNGDPKYLESNHLLIDLMWANPEDARPLINCIDQQIELVEYQTKNIVYNIYNSNLSTMYATLMVEYKDINEETVVANSKIYEYELSNNILTYTYEAILHTEDALENTEQELHNITLKIYADKNKREELATKNTRIVVTEAPYDLKPVGGETFYFDPGQKTNEELDFSANELIAWENNGYTITTQKDSFDWSNGGYTFDSEGRPCFCVKAGSVATINYGLFGNNQVKNSGKEFKIIFRTDKISTNNPSFLTCLEEKTEGKKIGFEMKSQEALLWQRSNYTYTVTGEWVFYGDPLFTQSIDISNIEFKSNNNHFSSIRFILGEGIYYNDNNNDILVYNVQEKRWLDEDYQNIDFGDEVYLLSAEQYAVLNNNAEQLNGQSPYLRLPYSENDIIELDFNIDHKNPLISGYEDGVASCWFEYSMQEDLHHETRQNIVIGSPYCDLYIYKMRIYEKFLTDEEILTNFKADGPTYQEKINRYKRNSEPLLQQETYSLEDLADLAEKLPDLRIICISAPVFTNDKDNKEKDTTINYFYHKGYETGDIPRWTAINCRHSGQGTSSNEYGHAGRNLDLIMDKSGYEDTTGIKPKIILEDGTETTKVALTQDSISVDYFNIKVNIASSENANNALLAKRYNKFSPFKRCLVDKNGERAIENIKDTMEFFNCLVFVQETDEDTATHREFMNHNYNFYALGNIGDSKKTDDTRVNNPDDVNEFIVEIQDVGLPNSDFGSGGDDYKNWETNSYKYGNQVSREDWDEITDYYIVDSRYYIDESLPALYDKIGDSYQKTQDTTIIRDKTYYAPSYKNPKYAGLQPSKFYLDEGEPTADDGWYKTYDFRYTHDDASDEQIQSFVDKWNEMYECIVFAPDYAEDETETFKYRFENLFDIRSVAYYYLFTLRYTMVDNRAKNTFWHYGKHYYTDEEARNFHNYADLKNRGYIDDEKAQINSGYRWDLAFDYDNDTSLGIDNRGRLKFRHGYEDKDVDDQTGNEVFRESDSLLFERFVNTFAAEIAEVYDSIDSQAWSSESLIAEFDNWQNQFPEIIWSRDIERKYKRTYSDGDKAFLVPMANGRKKYQRRQYERKQDKYMASKFKGSTFITDNIQLRCENLSGGKKRYLSLTITSKDYGYIGVEFGKSAPKTKKFAPGETKTFVFDELIDDNNYSTDTMDIYIRGANFISNLGDLSKLYLAQIMLNNAINLTSLELGKSLNSTESYTNGALTHIGWGKNDLISYLNLEGLVNLTTAPPAENLPRLESLYARNSGITGFELKNMYYLKEAYLPTTQILNISKTPRLKIIGLSGIEERGDNEDLVDNHLITLIIQDLPKDTYIVSSSELITSSDKQTYDAMLSKIENEEILHANISEILSNSCLYNTIKLERARLENIDWVLSDITTDQNWVPSLLLEYLYQIKGVSNDGKYIEEDSSTLTGKVEVPKMSTRFEDKYLNKWKELEIDPTEFITEYRVDFYNYNPLSGNNDLLHATVWGVHNENCQVPGIPVRNSTIDTIFTYNGWKDQNGISDISSSETEFTIYTNKIYQAIYQEDPREYTVYWLDDSGTALEKDGVSLTTKIRYGEGAEYPGDLPIKEPSDGKYYLFSGWNKYIYQLEPIPIGYDEYEQPIYSDEIRVSARFADSSPTATKIDLASQTPEMINANCLWGENAGQEGFEKKLYALGDTINITIGWDPDKETNSSRAGKKIFDLFENEVTAYYLNGSSSSKHLKRPLVMNHREGDIFYVDTGIKLCEADWGTSDDEEFTIMLDFQFIDDEVNNADKANTQGTSISKSYLLDCSEGTTEVKQKLQVRKYNTVCKFIYDTDIDDKNGIKVADIRERLGAIKYKFLADNEDGTRNYEPWTNLAEWSTSSYERLIIRKKKGSKELTIVKSQATKTWEEIKDKEGLLSSGAYMQTVTPQTITPHSNTLLLGCKNSLDTDGKLKSRCNCSINNLKIWSVALNDKEIEKMAIAPEETVSFWLTEFPRSLVSQDLDDNNRRVLWYEKINKNNDLTTKRPGIILESRDLLRNIRGWVSTTYDEKGEETQYEKPMSWKNSEIRNWLNGRIFKALPQVWQSAIKDVAVWGKDSTGIASYSKDKLFVLSYPEYGGLESIEGTPSALMTGDNKRIKFIEIGDSKYSWYNRTRSPKPDSSPNPTWYRIGTNGKLDGDGTSTTVAAVSFGFCI